MPVKSRPKRQSTRPCTIVSEQFRHGKRQYGVQPLVAHDHFLVLRVEPHAARHPDHSSWPADAPSWRHVAIVLDAPDGHIVLVRGHLLSDSVVGGDDPTL